MKKLLLTLALLSTTVQANTLYEYDFNEDRAMWEGDDYNIHNPVIPFVTKVSNTKDCKSARGVVYLYHGDSKDNHCGYANTSPAIVESIKDLYCDIAIRIRGGDLDYELAQEQGCWGKAK